MPGIVEHQQGFQAPGSRKSTSSKLGSLLHPANSSHHR
jgi:hypothetical protein